MRSNFHSNYADGFSFVLSPNIARKTTDDTYIVQIVKYSKKHTKQNLQLANSSNQPT